MIVDSGGRCTCGSCSRRCTGRRATHALHGRPDRALRRADRRQLRRLAAAAAENTDLGTLLAALQPAEDGPRDDIAILAVQRADESLSFPASQLAAVVK